MTFLKTLCQSLDITELQGHYLKQLSYVALNKKQFSKEFNWGKNQKSMRSIHFFFTQFISSISVAFEQPPATRLEVDDHLSLQKTMMRLLDITLCINLTYWLPFVAKNLSSRLTKLQCHKIPNWQNDQHRILLVHQN